MRTSDGPPEPSGRIAVTALELVVDRVQHDARVVGPGQLELEVVGAADALAGADDLVDQGAQRRRAGVRSTDEGRGVDAAAARRRRAQRLERARVDPDGGAGGLDAADPARRDRPHLPVAVAAVDLDELGGAQRLAGLELDLGHDRAVERDLGLGGLEHARLHARPREHAQPLDVVGNGGQRDRHATLAGHACDRVLSGQGAHRATLLGQHQDPAQIGRPNGNLGLTALDRDVGAGGEHHWWRHGARRYRTCQGS